MGQLIQTQVFSCNIPQFRARMQRLDNRLGARSWTSSGGVRLVFGEFPYTKWSYESIRSGNFTPMGMYTWREDLEEVPRDVDPIKRPSTRASWSIVPWTSTSMRPDYHPTKGFYFAGLEVYEIAAQLVRVDFLDSYNPEHPKQEFLPIGKPFIEFTSMLLHELSDIVKENHTVIKTNETSKQNNLVTELLDILTSCFNEEELKTFSLYLEVDYENLSAEGKQNKARELLLYFQRRNQIDVLINAGRNHRADIQWPNS